MFDTLLLIYLINRFMSGCWDSNPESPVPKTGMLAVTPHPDLSILTYFNSKTILYFFF